jgi:hypothetical protein
MVQLSKKKSGPVFEWLKQDGCYSHTKKIYLCTVLEWSISLDCFMNKENKRVKAGGTIKNQR